jgi:predicted amidophosphoribosyltransferase
MCKHDPAYKQSNESMGGVGCPICNAERNRYAAGTCPDCGRDLRTDMRDVAPDLLCDRCFEQWQTWADSAVAVSTVEPTSQYADSRDAAF